MKEEYIAQSFQTKRQQMQSLKMFFKDADKDTKRMIMEDLHGEHILKLKKLSVTKQEI